MSSSVRTGQVHAIVLVSWHLDLRTVAVYEPAGKGFLVGQIVQDTVDQIQVPQVAAVGATAFAGSWCYTRSLQKQVKGLKRAQPDISCP